MEKEKIEESRCLDIDEQMHEQQEIDEDYYERQAEYYLDLI